MIYLADDDADDLDIVRTALEEASFKGQIRTARDGQKLIDLLYKDEATFWPRVIVLDLNMPLKDGFQTLKEIKSDLNLNIPVIILTASSRKEDEARCFELGCSYFFTKPNRLKDYQPFVAMIKSLMGRHAA